MSTEQAWIYAFPLFSLNPRSVKMFSGNISSPWKNGMVEETVTIRDDRTTLVGFLEIPSTPAGIVLFSHGSGSGRFSPRNRFVARKLQQGGIATLLIDLLMTDEEEDRRNVFDIALLSDRVLMASAWLREDSRTRALPLSYFGASTGAASALQAAAQASFGVCAIVSRGGRPDLAERYLPHVTAPTLLLVGGEDHPVIEMNQQAYRLLGGPKQLMIIPGATHLFEEPGTLEQVSEYALKWFRQHFARPD
jgi:alpha-beta hydrolase superfamily lysophospholipase